jgi:hypothetical protein
LSNEFIARGVGINFTPIRRQRVQRRRSALTSSVTAQASEAVQQA